MPSTTPSTTSIRPSGAASAAAQVGFEMPLDPGLTDHIAGPVVGEGARLELRGMDLADVTEQVRGELASDVEATGTHVGEHTR